MNKLKSIYVAALATVATCSAMPTTEGQLQAPVSDTFLCVNVSGLYMGAQDSDVYYDFAGFSIKLGLYITQTTEIFGECSIADALDLPDYVDYSMNVGFLLGLTQYIPISDKAALYVRGKAGVTENTWSNDGDDYYDFYYGYDNNEESDSYLTYGIGAGFSVALSDNISLEVGYDYIGLDVSGTYEDDQDYDSKDWEGYHTIHAGLDFEF